MSLARQRLTVLMSSILDEAALREGVVHLVFAVAEGALGPFVCQMAPPERL